MNQFSLNKYNMTCYLIAAFFIVWSLANVSFKLGLIQDFTTPQRAGAIALVTYYTPIGIYFFSALGLIIGRFKRNPYFASFFASLPPFYQLWAYGVLPISTSMKPNVLALILYTFFLLLFPLVIHRNIEVANDRDIQRT